MIFLVPGQLHKTLRAISGGEATLLLSDGGPERRNLPAEALQSNEGNLGVRALLPAADGSLWIGMAVRARGAGLQHMLPVAFKPFLSPNLNRETLGVEALCADPQDSLWVATTQGLYPIRGTEVDHYENTDGLSSNWVKRY